jgi:purine nucleosidase
MKIHLDTDLGGDVDDLCALVMLLRWPDAEITGITTVAEVDSRRAGYVRHVLGLAQRQEIPVAAGASVSETHYRWQQTLLDEEAYWGKPIPPLANRIEDALSLLKQSVEQGAVIAAIGPYTNLRLLEQSYPGTLERARLVLMGGYVYPVRDGFPQWGNDMDYNVQVDAASALDVFEHSSPTLVPLSVTVETSLRRAYLPRLEDAGVLGELLARQARAFARDEQMEEKYGRTCRGLPGDTINFQHDPLACAIAMGWQDGVETREVPLRVELTDGWLHETVDSAAEPVHVVSGIDGNRFNEFWLDTVTNKL